MAVSLMEAFESSKRLAIQRLRAMPPTLYVFGRQFQQEVDEVFGADPVRLRHHRERQGVRHGADVLHGARASAPRKQPWDEIFPEEVFYREERAASSSGH